MHMSSYCCPLSDNNIVGICMQLAVGECSWNKLALQTSDSTVMYMNVTHTHIDPCTPIACVHVVFMAKYMYISIHKTHWTINGYTHS